MDNHGTFLQLVRLGVDKNIGSLPEYINWEEMDALATKQGLLGVLLDGIQRLADGADKIPYKKRLEWLGQVMQGYERRYVEYRKAIDALDAFYNTHGYKMMLLKGYACGRDWPRPEHRPYGDIDIWLFGKQKEADDVLVREKGIKIDNSHHHHTVFSWMGFTVENHYDFINIHHHRSNAELEKIFKKLGQDDGQLCRDWRRASLLAISRSPRSFSAETSDEPFRIRKNDLTSVAGLGFLCREAYKRN